MKVDFKTLALFSCVMISLSGGVLAQQKPGQALKEPAKDFWEARIKGDWATVYRYLSPMDKDKFTQDQFVSSRKEKGPFRYLSYKLGDVEIAGQLGWVEVSYTVEPVGFANYPARHMHIWQVWQEMDDRWYPVPASQRAEVPKKPPHMRPAEEEASLIRRAHEFWNAKEREDWLLIYQYLDPAFTSEVSSEEFLEKTALFSYLSHRVEWAEVTGDRGRVKLTYACRLKDPSLAKSDPIETGVVEEWIKVNSHWYRQLPEGRAE